MLASLPAIVSKVSVLPPAIVYLLALRKVRTPTVCGEVSVMVVGAVMESVRLAIASGALGTGPAQLAALVQFPLLSTFHFGTMTVSSTFPADARTWYAYPAGASGSTERPLSVRLPV